MPSDPFPTHLLLDAFSEVLESQARPMHDVVLVPCSFTVELSDQAYAESEGYRSMLADQIKRRLDAELSRLNASGPSVSVWQRILSWVTGNPTTQMAYDRGEDQWTVRFTRDTERALPANAFAIHSGYSGGAGEAALAGGRTVFEPSPGAAAVAEEAGRDAGRTVFSGASPSAAMAEGRRLAWVRYEDDEGLHKREIGAAYRDRPIKIGRRVDGTDWREIPVAVEADVSRDHARLRYDAKQGRFELLDTSLHGTTLNGEPVPSSHGDYAEHVWVPVPARAEIGLAGAVTLHFEQVAEDEGEAGEGSSSARSDS